MASDTDMEFGELADEVPRHKPLAKQLRLAHPIVEKAVPEIVFLSSAYLARLRRRSPLYRRHRARPKYSRAQGLVLRHGSGRDGPTCLGILGGEIAA